MEIKKIDSAFLAAWLKPRPADASKTDFGNILLIAGRHGMCGAAALGAMAALRSGAGLVRVALPQEDFPILQILAPEAICMERGAALAGLDHFQAIGIGPGIGTSEEARDLLAQVLTDYHGPLVLDADALNLVAQDGELRKLVMRYGESAGAATSGLPGTGDGASAQILITPHEGEAARLINGLRGGDGKTAFRKREGETKEERETRRIDTACYLAENLHCTVLLKGKGTLIVSRQEDAENACNLTGDAGAIFRNPTGNPGMATAGAGDVLTGVITALLGQGLEVTAAACCGAYLHGRAGDLAAAEYGERSLIARDLIRKLPAAFRSGTLTGSGD